jgi:hypothetical protein
MEGMTMTDTIDLEYPDLCTEIHRYERPEDVYRFHTLLPRPVSERHSNHRPFSPPGYNPQAQNYIEAERHQVHTGRAEELREGLVQDGYRPIKFIELPEVLAKFVTYQQAPLEFQLQLSQGVEFVTDRIVVWVRGELPV